MTARLTDDEIHKLRELSATATKGPAHAVNLDGYHEARVVAGGRVVLRCDTLDDPACQIEVALAASMRNAIDRLLDELLEHRAREKLEKWREIPLPAGVAEFIKMNKANASKAVQP